MFACPLVRTFQSTRPSRGETPRAYPDAGGIGISIHSPLAGRDVDGLKRSKDALISIHSPLAGRDQGGSFVATEW